MMMLTTSSNGEHGFAVYQVKGDQHHLPAPDDQNSDARSSVFDDDFFDAPIDEGSQIG